MGWMICLASLESQQKSPIRSRSGRSQKTDADEQHSLVFSYKKAPLLGLKIVVKLVRGGCDGSVREDFAVG